jgi:hypothetical protein
MAPASSRSFAGAGRFAAARRNVARNIYGRRGGSPSAAMEIAQSPRGVASFMTNRQGCDRAKPEPTVSRFRLAAHHTMLASFS